MLTPQEIAAGATGVGDLSFGNPPQQGGFLRPTKQQVDPLEYDWELRRQAYDVLKSRGDAAADTSDKFQDVRDYYSTGVLPQTIQGLYTRQGREVSAPPQQTEQPQQSGLFRRATSEQGTTQTTAQPDKPRWDYSKTHFAQITTVDDEDEKNKAEMFNKLGEKWQPAVQSALDSKFTGVNVGSKGNVNAFNETGSLIPWMFKKVFNMNPDQIAKLPPATRREMMSDIIDAYHQSVSPEQWEAMGLGDVEQAKQATYKRYGSDEAKDENSWVGSFGTLAKSIGKGATQEAGNVFAFLEGELGDGNADTGVGKAYKVSKALGDWISEDNDNGELTAAKMRLMTLLQQDRLGDAAALVARNGELRMSVGGELLGQIGLDAAAMAAGGSVIPGAGTAAGGTVGAAKGLFSAGSRMYKLWQAAKMAAKAAPLQGIQSGGAMYSDLFDRDINITPEVRDLVHDAEIKNMLITAFTPGNLEGSVINLSKTIRANLRAKGVDVAEDKINSSAREIANILASRGIQAAEGVVEKATPWERVKGVITKPAQYVAKAVPEAVQEGLTSYNEGATAKVQDDGTIRELTDAEQANRITQAGFEAILGGAATAPRTFTENHHLSKENQALSDAYVAAHKAEQIEADVKNQSEEFQALYAMAEGTPEERFKMAQDTLKARDEVQQSMNTASTTDQSAYTPDNSVNERLASVSQGLVEDGLEGLTLQHKPLHNYYVPPGQEKVTNTARNTVIKSLDGLLQSGTLSEDDAARITGIRNQVDQGDLSGVVALNDKTLLEGTNLNKSNFERAVTRLTQLQPVSGVETEADAGVKRFTVGDRNTVATLLSNIQGNKTGVNANALLSSIENVRNNLSTAADSVAKQKGLEQLNVIEKIVRNDLPENLPVVKQYFNRVDVNKRYSSPTATAFQGDLGRGVLDNTRSNVKSVVNELTNAGVDSATTKSILGEFNRLVETNPEVAFTRLKQRVSSLGNSIANNDRASQTRSFLNPERTANARNQHLFTGALDAINQVEQNVRTQATQVIVPQDINSRIFSQQGTPTQAQSDVGQYVNAIRFALKGMGIQLPTNQHTIKNPVQQLALFQQTLHGTPEVAASNVAEEADIAQARDYVDTVLDALTTGNKIPEASPVIKYYAEQQKAIEGSGNKDTYIPPPADAVSTTAANYVPRPLHKSVQGKRLFAENVAHNKVAESFEVVDTENGPLVFLNGKALNGEALATAAKSSANGSELDPLYGQVKENTEAMKTSDTMDGGDTTKQDKDFEADVATATAEEFNAQNVVKQLNSEGGIDAYITRVMSNPAVGGRDWTKSSIAQSLHQLVKWASREGSPIRLPEVQLSSIPQASNGTFHKAYYEYNLGGGVIHINEDMATDANFQEAMMHELLHWAVSQRQYTFLQTGSSKALNVVQDIALQGGTFDQLQRAVARAKETAPQNTPEEQANYRLLEELNTILSGNHDSNVVWQQGETLRGERGFLQTSKELAQAADNEYDIANTAVELAEQTVTGVRGKIKGLNEQITKAKAFDKKVIDAEAALAKAQQDAIVNEKMIAEKQGAIDKAGTNRNDELKKLLSARETLAKAVESNQTKLGEAQSERAVLPTGEALETRLTELTGELKGAEASLKTALATLSEKSNAKKLAHNTAHSHRNESDALNKNRQTQITFEELLGWVMDKTVSGEIDSVNSLLRNSFPAELSFRELADAAATALTLPFKKNQAYGQHALFTDKRVTYAGGKKQPTLIRYGFKQGNTKVSGDPVAYLDPATNSWSLHYLDSQGVPHLETGLTFTRLGQVARSLELWAGRIEKNRVVQKTPAKMMTELQRFSPSVYKFLSRINKLLRGTDDDLKAPIRQLASIIAGQGVRQQGITSWFKQIENAILNTAGADVRDQLESKYNEIRQQFQYELSENPLTNEQNIRSLMEKVYTLMRDSGYPKEKIDNMLYALEAEDRHHRTLKEHPVDPLTGKRRTNADNLTGFMLPNADNTDSDIDDSDGAKYRATWTTEEQNFAKNLKQMYIELNNRVLEFEHMAGRMTDKQFNELYGKFYMPLRNDDDGATAFAKRVTGRRTKADSPMTHFQANMMARLKSAEQSMIMQELMDTLAEHPVDGFVSFNSTTLTKTDKGRYQQRADGFVKGNTITFFRDGMKHTVTVDDPIFAKALKAQRDSAAKDDVTQMYMKVLAKVVSWFAQVRTQTPPFFVTSLFRDSAMTLVNHQAAFRGKSGLSAMEHQALAVETVAYAARNLGNMLKWRASPESADWRYKVYRKYGGVGHSEQFDLENTRKQLGEDVFAQHKGFLGGVANKGTKAKRKWQDIMHASDDLLRFATWIKFVEKKAGRKFSSEADLKSFLVNNPDISRLATDGSKNITGNFQNKGMGNQFERSHFIFWNAAMTGINSALRMLNPRYGMQGIAASGTLFSLMFLQGLSAPDDDDDGKSKFFRIKGLGDGLVVGNVMWTLPQEIVPYAHLGTGLSGLVTGNFSVGEASKHVMTGFLKGYTPFTPAETGEPLFDTMYSFIPTIWQPVALRAMGKNFYGGDSLPKAYDADGKEMPDAPNAARVRDSDSGWSVEMAHAMYSATNGAVDMSPGAVEDVPKQVLGGVYSMFNNYFTEYNKNGGDAINAAASALFKGKSAAYNEFALQESVNKRFEKLQSKLRAGDEFNDMFRGKDDLPEDYNEVVKLKKQMMQDIKDLEDNGESLNTIRQRIKQLRLDDGSPQELFELQTRAANIYAQRNYVYGQYMNKLDELGID